MAPITGCALVQARRKLKLAAYPTDTVNIAADQYRTMRQVLLRSIPLYLCQEM
jgi:hypothetical protein